MTSSKFFLAIVPTIDLDRIITQIVKPKVSVYMAIDGVAPRAKLNQQRSRRFRSAKDMLEAAQEKAKQNRNNSDDNATSDKAVFDSNCITPGTEFLLKVSEMIQYFIRKKLKEDVAWRNLLVIFSGPDIPGEGEHKIMSHIRAMRNNPDYQPNTRHCIYGQDADLIMLGLVTHEPHFTILREVVNFNSFQQNKNALKEVKKFTKESDFQLLHLSLLREYLQIEFVNDYKEKNYDLERVIDDFVFMTFLVGNDFLPHMPTLDIGDGAFDLLFGVYKDHRRHWESDQYLTDRGDIMDPARLESFLAAIGAVETEILEKREDDEAVYIQKRRKWDKRDGKEAGPSDEDLQDLEDEKQNGYMAMLQQMLSKHDEKDFVDGWAPVKDDDKKDFKGRYYFEKLELTPVDKEKHWALRRSYMEGLRWCLAYYYKGCISWGWFYPYHYGPMLSDLINIPKMFEEIKFELGAPLTPFQQLMGCLPPASSILVPKLYRWLMTSPDSPIIQFYPQTFDVDMNGKKYVRKREEFSRCKRKSQMVSSFLRFRNPWEGVNLLPFIDISLLKETIAIHCPASKLPANEAKRNSMGKVCFYRYDVSCTDLVESPNKEIGLPDLNSCHSSVTEHDEDLGLSGLVFEPKLMNGTKIPYPGFPSLNVMPIASTELIGIGLNCFGMPSKYPTMVLTMHPMPELPPVEILAQNVIGKALFVNWPMMHEGKVVAISDSTKEVRMVNGSMQVKIHADVAAERWIQDSDLMTKSYYGGNGSPGSGGINVNEINIRLKVLPLQGMKTNPSNGSTSKVFGREEADIPLQLALWQAPAPDPRFIERGPMTLKDRFPEGCNVVLTKGKFRGCLGTVVGMVDMKNVGVRVYTVPPEMPFGLAIARSVQEAYLSSYDASRVLKISPSVLGKIMGRIPFVQGNYDLGLNLKSADGFCVIGYTRKKFDESKGGNGASKNGNVWAGGDTVLVVGSRGNTEDSEDERITWEYTPKAVRLVEQYRAKFPQLFAALNQSPNERKYNANQVFGPNGESLLPVVREWLDKNESAKLPRSPVTTQSMSYEATVAVQKAADVRSLALKKKGYPKESQVKVPGSALYREASTSATDVILATDINDGEGPEIGDRVVNLCADGVPFGARGTVIGIHEAATSGSVEIVMDEEFIGGTSLQGHCANFRGKLCHWSNLLKIAPDNSQGLVDKLVPKGVKEAALAEAVNQIVATSVDASSKPAAAIPGPQSSKHSNQKKADVLVNSKPKTPTRSARSDSSGRNRQGGWKEARGPDEKSVGFKREGPSGLTRWRNFTKARAENPPDASSEMKQLASELKQTLRIGNNVEDQLKAMLGVTGPSSSNSVQIDSSSKNLTPASQTASNVSDELKAILGVSSVPSAAIPHQQVKSSEFPAAGLPPPTVTSAPTAADKLLQILSSKQQQQQQGYVNSNFHHGPTTSSPFNFTYFEEGKEPPSVPANGGMGMPTYPMPHPPVAFHPNYAIPGVMHSMPQHIMYPVPAVGAPPAPVPVPIPKFNPPVDEFPPLSLHPQPPSKAIDNPPPVLTPEPAIVNQSVTSVSHIKPASVLVPSAVKIRK